MIISNIRVEKLRLRDFIAMRDFIQAFMNEKSGKVSKASNLLFPEFGALSEIINSYFGVGPCFVAKAGDKIVGFLEIMNLPYKSLIGIGVLEEFQSKGIGRLLLKKTDKYIKKRVFGRTMCAKTLGENSRANAFFQMNDFKKYKTKKQWNYWKKKV